MAFVDATQAGNGQTTTVTALSITVPATTASGQVAVLTVVNSTSTATLTTPSGWSVRSGPDPVGSNAVTWALTKTLGSSDPGASVSLSFGATSGRCAAGMRVYSDVTATGLQVAKATETASTGSPTLPILSGVPAGATLDASFMRRRAGTAPTVTMPGAYTTATDSTAATNYGSAVTNVSGLAGYAVGSAGGSVGGESGSAGLTSVGTNYLVALPPATTVAGTGTITLSGSVTAQARVSAAAGTVTLGGTATGTAPGGAAGIGSITLGGTADAAAPPPLPPPYVPALTPPQLPDQGSWGLRVAFYDLNYRLQGYANDYEACAVTFQHLDVGTGSLVVAETSPLVPVANLAGQQVVPVTVTDRYGNRWSGRVDAPSTDEGDGSSQSVPGSGLTTITLVDEWVWFKRILAAPWGASTQMAYTAPTTDPEFDVRTGAVETVVKGYITDALARIYGVDTNGNPLGPITVVPAPSVDASATVTLQAKWTPIADLVTDTLRSVNWTLTITLWLPGDDQPLGLVNPLTAPTLVVDMHASADNSWVIWDDDNFLSRKIAVKSPTSYGGVFGGDGSGTDQTFTAYADAGLQASQGLFGFPEQFFSSSTSSSPEAQLEATEGSLAVDAAVQDGAPWTFGQDYVVGDIVGVRALGIDVRERVTAVQMVDDRDKGYRLVPTIGDDAATLTPTAQLFKTIRELGTRVASIETGR